MSETFFQDLTIIETDQKQLESIDRLQKAFSDVRRSYRREYQDSLNHLLTNVKDKLKNNEGMVEAVEMYVSKFVSVEKRQNAEEELYNLLAAEILQTMHALQHASCCVM